MEIDDLLGRLGIEVSEHKGFWRWRITVNGVVVRHCDHPHPAAAWDSLIGELGYLAGCMLEWTNCDSPRGEWVPLDLCTGEIVRRPGSNGHD